MPQNETLQQVNDLFPEDCSAFILVVHIFYFLLIGSLFHTISYSAAVSAPISNRECSSLSCSIYLLRSETALPGELLALAVVGVLCFITSLIEFASPVNASFYDVEPDRRDLPTENSGELGGSSVLS